jgi:hypothetical protein
MLIDVQKVRTKSGHNKVTNISNDENKKYLITLSLLVLLDKIIQDA